MKAESRSMVFEAAQPFTARSDVGLVHTNTHLAAGWKSGSGLTRVGFDFTYTPGYSGRRDSPLGGFDDTTSRAMRGTFQFSDEVLVDRLSKWMPAPILEKVALHFEASAHKSGRVDSWVPPPDRFFATDDVVFPKGDPLFSYVDSLDLCCSAGVSKEWSRASRTELAVVVGRGREVDIRQEIHNPAYTLSRRRSFSEGMNVEVRVSHEMAFPVVPNVPPVNVKTEIKPFSSSGRSRNMDWKVSMRI